MTLKAAVERSAHMIGSNSSISSTRQGQELGITLDTTCPATFGQVAAKLFRKYIERDDYILNLKHGPCFLYAKIIKEFYLF